MKVAVIQMNSVADKARNVAAARALMERAVAEEKPDWLLLPEHFDWAGGSRGDKLANSEEIGAGPASDMCRDFARRHGTFVHAGSIMERARGGERIRNTSVVYDRRGEEVARYSKIHLFDIVAPDGAVYRESDTVTPGETVATYECEGVTVGCAICYDLRFPELFAALVDRGATMVALPAAFTLQTGKDHWELLLRARAVETQAYVCASAQCGSFVAPGGEARHTFGHSLVADPWGHVVARASDGAGYAVARLDPARIERVRAAMPVRAHARRLREPVPARPIAAE
ncbi:MAG: carbon-nitrogen hydrolase family protein [Hyphomicrobiales bacterium]|nr:carbon-nitrogen hydrolase family protein [Hyphomicrobiales bacterium]MDE2016666.1 carbon-nitrogen hydrolase family protein [Hyphomicrobiales bacterium]